MKYQIRFTDGEYQDQVFPIGATALSIGRSHSNVIHLQTADVSGKHVNLTLTDKGILLENFSSRVTTVDDAPVAMGDRVNLVAAVLLGISAAPIIDCTFTYGIYPGMAFAMLAMYLELRWLNESKPLFAVGAMLSIAMAMIRRLSVERFFMNALITTPNSAPVNSAAKLVISGMSTLFISTLLPVREETATEIAML